MIKADKILLACGRESISWSGDLSGIHVIGDARGKCFLAPAAEREAEVAIGRILGKSGEIDYFNIPHTIFTDPEIACVGFPHDPLQRITSEKCAQFTGRYRIYGYMVRF